MMNSETPGIAKHYSTGSQKQVKHLYVKLCLISIGKCKP